MKITYLQALKGYLANHMRKTRKELGMTQAQMAEKLELDLRSYSNVDNGKSLCSTLTFILYLLYICPDVPKLLDEIKETLESTDKKPTEEPVEEVEG